LSTTHLSSKPKVGINQINTT